MSSRPTLTARQVAVGGKVLTRTTAKGEQRWLFKWQAGGGRSHSFTSELAAEQFRIDLVTANGLNQPFDLETGLPVHMLPAVLTEPAMPKAALTVIELAQHIVNAEWNGWSPGNRKTRVETMAETLAHLTVPTRGAVPTRNDRVRALKDLVLPPAAHRMDAVTEEVAAAGVWVLAKSLPADQLTLTLIEETLLAAVVKMDGEWYEKDRRGQHRGSLSLICDEAMRRELINSNFVARARRLTPTTTVDPDLPVEELEDEDTVVDPQRVASPEQCRALIARVGTWSSTSWQYVAYLTLLLMTGMRPSEAAGIRCNDKLFLPETGWGYVRLSRPLVASGARWTGTGRQHATRLRLKARKVGAERKVPLHPDAVAALRTHIAKMRTAPGALLFVNSKGNPFDPSARDKVWRKVRAELHPTGSLSGLSVYQLRHSAATLLLRKVGAQKAAEVLGNSAPVLLRTYARCLDTDDAGFEAAMEDAFR